MKNKRESGILCHITSLYTKYGIGDLGQAAFNFIDFLKKSGQRLWQILPLGPTSYGDSPYASFSTFAGNPLLICPDKLVDWGLLTDIDVHLDYIFPDNIVDYKMVSEFKYHMLRLAYANFVSGADKNLTAKYEDFVESNAHWLLDYSLFISLKNYFLNKRKDEVETQEYNNFVKANKNTLSASQIKNYYYGAVWQSWPMDISSRKPEAILKWRKQLKDEIGYSNFLQFIFFKQFEELKTYATKAEIKIVGDIPIFVAYDSADCWAHKDLFMLDAQGIQSSVAGVPPDYFSEDGQLWGNPLFEWANHKKTGYIWWLSRISKALETCDILRIDHFRGFESFWAVPNGAKNAKKGKWLPGPRKDFFDAINKHFGNLPIIAEDLGIITPAVEELRDSLNLPGMKVLQFAFDASTNNNHLPHNYINSNMVVYTGTHDNDTSLGWYAQASDDIKDHFRRYLNVNGDNAAWDMIRLAFLSIANTAIIPIQDIFNMDSYYRMNTPGTMGGNWQFRLRQEHLQSYCQVAKQLQYLSKLSDRNA